MLCADLISQQILYLITYNRTVARERGRKARKLKCFMAPRRQWTIDCQDVKVTGAGETKVALVVKSQEPMWESGICGTLVFCTVVGPIADTTEPRVRGTSRMLSMSSSLSSAQRRFMSVWPLIPLPDGLERFKSAQTSTTNYGYF